MKYILITLLLVSGSIQAKSFSLSDYAATTGKIPPKVVKNTNSPAERVKDMEIAIIKEDMKIANLRMRISEIGRAYSENIARVSKMKGDTSSGRSAASMDRSTRLFTVNNEIAKCNKRLGELKERLVYYKILVKAEKMAGGLRARGLISSIS